MRLYATSWRREARRSRQLVRKNGLMPPMAGIDYSMRRTVSVDIPPVVATFAVVVGQFNIEQLFDRRGDVGVFQEQFNEAFYNLDGLGVTGDKHL